MLMVNYVIVVDPTASATLTTSARCIPWLIFRNLNLNDRSPQSRLASSTGFQVYELHVLCCEQTMPETYLFVLQVSVDSISIPAMWAVHMIGFLSF
jgi:hypothetical protein